MTNKCNGCGENIATQDFMNCNKCHAHYDILCLNIPKATFTSYTVGFKRDWLCPECQCAAPKSDNTPVRGATTAAKLSKPLTDNSNINVTRGGQKPTKAKAATNKSDSDTSGSVAMTNTKVATNKSDSDISSVVEEIRLLRQEILDMKSIFSKKLEEYEKVIATQSTEILDLKAAVSILQENARNTEQRALKNEIEVIGVPETENEGLQHLAILVSKKMGVDLSESDIDTVFRAGPRRSTLSSNLPATINYPRPLVVKLVRHAKRNEIIKASKIRKNLNSEGIAQGPVAKMYVNERLTKENRLLFREARTRAHNYNFRYCWTRDGSIYIKKADGRPAIHIKSQEDLDQHIGAAPIIG
ncbi:unnamed protein product [Plutella xylostella]|uniref:(diamondback moth) hypothetical protein n=1 Tax=Plutella xylostella TaxID=51655 RepID=A0A8S4EJA9_PLUXY|nr:unnamed protein product [Plutella xylostella]